MIERLELSGFRCLAGLHLAFRPGLNFLYGQNGAGKTSILEAVHVLSSGRSFRGGRAEDWLQRGSTGWAVAATLAEGQRWAVQWVVGRNALAVRDGVAVPLAIRARMLPVLCLHPDSQRQFFAEREARRRLLDWLVFHVEPAFSAAYAEYGRCLRQRNEVLRHDGSNDALRPWTELCAASGAELQRLRASSLPALQRAFDREASKLFGTRLQLRLRLMPGWVGPDLEQALEAARVADHRSMTTTVGPHRADLRIEPHGRRSGQDLSRGEAKVALYALSLACWQVAVVERMVVGTLLLDDIGAELDADLQGAVLRRLEEFGGQVLATGVYPLSRPEYWQRPWQSFHVKHGAVTAAE